MGDKYANLHSKKKPKLTPEQVKERRKYNKSKKQIEED